MEKNLTVDETMMESVLDDAAPAPETNADALSEALNQLAPDSTVEAGQQSGDDQLEMPSDKGLRGRMMQFEQRGYKRGAQEAESKWAAERKDYQDRIAKYEQMELEAEAKKFAQEKNIPEDIALDYLRMKKGQPVAEQPRDEAGRFAAPEQQPAVESDTAMNDSQARAVTLMTQAEAFEKMSSGMVTKDDILGAFQNDAEVRRKVVSGEWDFTDVGRALSDNGQQRAPRVSRSASNGKVSANTFIGMSDAEFAMFDNRISQGAVFDARR